MLIAGLARGEFDQCDGFHFLNNHKKQVPSTWLLLDNQSTVDIFNNASMLKNIRKSITTMNIHCNAGIASTSMVGGLPGYGTVWYHPEGITNILSLARIIEKGYHVALIAKMVITSSLSTSQMGAHPVYPLNPTVDYTTLT